MADSISIGFAIYSYYLEQSLGFKRITGILILAGFLYYYINYFWWILVQRRGDLTHKISENWGQFLLKEVILLGISILNNYIAIGIFAYRIMICGLMHYHLGLQSEKKSGCLVKWFGFFMHRVVPILAILTVLVFIILGDRLWGELISILIVTMGFDFKRNNIMKYSDSLIQRSSVLKFAYSGLWSRVSIFSKVSVLCILIAVPLFGYGIFSTSIYSSKQNIMIPMRDGHKLMTHIYYPPNWDGRPLPIIMSRTPYNSESEDLVRGYVYQYVAQQGYILVLQDLRGRYQSEGQFPVFASENTDGVDTVAWLMNQVWSNKRIASIGGSAVCTNQYYYHAEGPDGMASANLLCGASELYDYWMFPGGCYRKAFSDWWLPAVGAATQPLIYAQHAAKDGYWANMSLGMNNRAKNINMRALHVGGWYDVFAQGTVTGFQYYNNGTDYAQDHQILIMGPWGHGTSSVFTNITFPDPTGNQIINSCEKFLFDESLWNKTQDWTNQPRVYYYVMGDPDSVNSNVTYNHWRTAGTWPLTNTTQQAWYFHPNGSLSSDIPTNQTTQSYLYNPLNPVRTCGGNTLFVNESNGAVDQASVEKNRNDILSFTSPILTTPVEILGRLSATLFIQSNCTDTDFTVKLMDVYPDGRQMYVASGILKTRYRNGFTPENVALMTPETTYQLNLDLWSTAYHFVPGHQIKVSVSSSNSPEFAPNPNTGSEVFSDSTITYVANNSILLGVPGQLSSIIFPRNI